MEWEIRERFKSVGTYVCLGLIYVAIWQKPTQYCKVLILQLKINKFLKIKESMCRECRTPVETYY